MSRATYEKVDEPLDDFSESDGEYDNPPLLANARRSSDLRRRDKETLEAEEVAERLLSGGGGDQEKASNARKLFTRSDDEKRQRRRDGRRQRRRRKHGEGGEESELMYEMEEGAPRSSSAESSGHSSEMDMRRLKEVQAKQKTSKVPRCTSIAAILLVIVAGFLAFLYGAYQASPHGTTTTTTTTKPSSQPLVQSLSNGTHIFAPTTLLISLDGFRADFLTRGLTPTLNAFIRSGVSPQYMAPCFPSLTFPNHFTLVTGLYPESHGIVGNDFYDPAMQREFYYTDPAHSMQPEWWNAEPLWVTAESAGVRTAIHMWPGSEAHIGNIEPAYVDEFNQDEQLERKVERIFHWLDLPGTKDVGAKEGTPRPQLIAAYVPNVDSDGHKYGPNSTYIRSTIAQVDGMLGTIFNGIDERNLTDIVNIIVVSDHGMATTSSKRLIQLEDVVDASLIQYTDGWPLYGLRPYDTSPANIKKIHKGLVAMADLPKYRGAFDVYLRDQDMPARYHFSKNERIAPLWIVPRAGWAIVPKHEFHVEAGRQQGLVYHPRGLHGYDHQHPLMRAIFVARGPAFPHAEGSQLDNFQNTEVYNIVCDSLGIEPKPNNGTLRLPLTPKGKHNFDEEPEIAEDWPDEESKEDQLPPEVPNLANRPTGFPTLPSGSPLPPIPPLQPIAPEEVDQVVKPNALKRPIVHGGLTEDEEEPKELHQWWEWVKGKLEAIKHWAVEHLGSNGQATDDKAKSQEQHR